MLYSLLKRLYKPLILGAVSCCIWANCAAPTLADAPLYKDTMVAAGLFPWTPTWQQSIERAKQLGFTRVRMDMTWSSIESQPGQYDFSFYDKAYKTMVSKGVWPVFILAYNNPIYGPKKEHPKKNQWGIDNSANRIAYARFVKAAAAHFKGKGVVWEVWNEPDIPEFWGQGPNPKDFASLAQSAIQAIRKADPNAYVINGGFSHAYWSKNYIQVALASGLLKGYNAMAFHGYDYTDPKYPIETQESLWKQYRQWMFKYNDGKVLPIVNSEYGQRPSWLKDVCREPMDLAAKQTIRMNLENYYGGVFLTSVYGIDPNDEFNLAKDSLTTQALAFTNALLGPMTGANQNYGPHMRAILFTDPGNGQKVLAWWPTTFDKVTVTFPQPLTIKKAYNALGNPVANAGTLTSYTGHAYAGPIFFQLD